MFYSRRCLTAPPLTLVAGVLFFIVIMTKQVKDIYDRNQKYYRMQAYDEFINDVSQSMVALEINSNKSSASLNRLTAILRDRKDLSKSIQHEKTNS